MKKMMIFALTLTASTAMAQSPTTSDLGAWTERTLALRAEVEQRAKAVEEMAQAQAAEREQLRQRKLEIAALARKEEMRQAQLQEKRDRLKKRLRVEGTLSKERQQELLAWNADLGTWISGSLPFRRTERLRVVQDLEARILRGEAYEKLVADLWSATEKELQLTRENSFEVVTLDLAGNPGKAEVARAGMVQMAYLAADGRAGFAHKEGTEWKLSGQVSDAEAQAARRMVERFREHGGRGYFEIPLPKEVL